MNLIDGYKFAFLICVFCFSAACGITGTDNVRLRPDSPVGVGSDPGSAAPELVTPGSDPNEAIAAASRKFFTARSVRSRSVSTMPNGATLTTTTEFVAPDRTHTVIENSLGDRSESISIGSRSFTSINGKWEVSPLDIKVGYEAMHGTDAEYDELTKKAPVPGGSTKLVGPSSIDGKKVLVYQTTNTVTTENRKVTVSVRMSIGILDGRLYRMESESAGGLFNTKSFTDFSDYDTDIRIDSPV